MTLVLGAPQFAPGEPRERRQLLGVGLAPRSLYQVMFEPFVRKYG